MVDCSSMVEVDVTLEGSSEVSSAAEVTLHQKTSRRARLHTCLAAKQQHEHSNTLSRLVPQHLVKHTLYMDITAWHSCWPAEFSQAEFLSCRGHPVLVPESILVQVLQVPVALSDGDTSLWEQVAAVRHLCKSDVGHPAAPAASRESFLQHAGLLFGKDPDKWEVQGRPQVDVSEKDLVRCAPGRSSFRLLQRPDHLSSSLRIHTAFPQTAVLAQPCKILFSEFRIHAAARHFHYSRPEGCAVPQDHQDD